MWEIKQLNGPYWSYWSWFEFSFTLLNIYSLTLTYPRWSPDCGDHMESSPRNTKLSTEHVMRAVPRHHHHMLLTALTVVLIMMRPTLLSQDTIITIITISSVSWFYCCFMLRVSKTLAIKLVIFTAARNASCLQFYGLAISQSKICTKKLMLSFSWWWSIHENLKSI